MIKIKGFQFVTRVLLVLAIAGILVPAVHAGWGDVSTVQAPFVLATASGNAQALVQRAAQASSEAAVSGAQMNTATIVGMWRFQFISLGNTAHNPPIPDGALVDFGYTQWHSDGNEMTNSGGHAPATGNFRMERGCGVFHV